MCRPSSCQPYAQKPNHLNPGLYTHVVYAFVKVDPGNYSVMDVEPNDKQQIQQMNDLKKGNGGLKTMISIGGWSFSRATETFTGEHEPACQGTRSQLYVGNVDSLRRAALHIAVCNCRLRLSAGLTRHQSLLSCT